MISLKMKAAATAEVAHHQRERLVNRAVQDTDAHARY